MAAIPTPLSAPAAGPVDLGPPPPSGQSNTMPFLAVAATLGGNSPSHGREWVDGLLRQAVERGASDLHIHVGYAPMVRENGNLAAFELPLLSAEDTEGGLMEILSPDQREAFEQNHDLDLAYAIEGVARFRVNIFRQRRGVDAVFRVVPLEAPSLADLGLPESLGSFTEFHNGMVLFTGPAGCGKSTTLAAMVKLLNHSRRHHIITVEDPVEFVHPSEQCIVNHRQVHQHTESFGRALRAALREDPDVIVVGELRDLESIQLAITAAETGHLVMGTLHTTGAIRTIYRMLDVFPPNQQAQIRVMLSESLRGIISQRLVPAIRTLDGPVRVPILEVLNVTPAVSNLIRDEKMFQIRSIMQTGRSQGMCTLEDSLEDLLKKQLITRQDAMRYAIDKERFIAQRGGP